MTLSAHVIFHPVVENPNAPVICLRSPSPLMTIEFNPHDPSLLISGLMSGQVCNWDVRIGNRPVQMSHRQFSHRYLSISEWEVPRDLRLAAEIIGQNLNALDFDVWRPESQISAERNAAKPVRTLVANTWINAARGGYRVSAVLRCVNSDLATRERFYAKCGLSSRSRDTPSLRLIIRLLSKC